MKKQGIFLKKGLTLIEMLVALALFMFGIQATVLIFSKTMKNKAYSMEMGKSALIVSRSISDLTQYLRRIRQADNGNYPIPSDNGNNVSCPILNDSANDNEFVFYSDYDKDGKTERIDIYLSPLADLSTEHGRIVYMKIRRPSATLPVTYAPCYEAPVQLASHIVNTAGDPMFSYYNKNYPADIVNNPLATPANVSQIRLVKIFLKINVDPNRAPDNIQQETFVEFRNLNDYDRIH